MRRKVVVGAIFMIGIIIVLLLGLLYNMAAKNTDYKHALERKEAIAGSWTSDGHTFLSIDNNEGSNEFTIVKDNQEIKSGTVKKTDENYYLLYNGETDDVYAKIIPSYEKIYIIKKDLDIKEYKYFSEALVGPSKNKEQ